MIINKQGPYSLTKTFIRWNYRLISLIIITPGNPQIHVIFNKTLRRQPHLMFKQFVLLRDYPKSWWIEKRVVKISMNERWGRIPGRHRVLRRWSVFMTAPTMHKGNPRILKSWKWQTVKNTSDIPTFLHVFVFDCHYKITGISPLVYSPTMTCHYHQNFFVRESCSYTV